MAIKICKNRDELFDMLWADYQENKKRANKKVYDKESMQECFIYSYYKNKKTRKANELAESADKFREYSKYTRDKFVLLCAAHRLWKNDASACFEIFEEVFSKAAERENGGKHFRELFKTDPDQAYEELSYKLLCGVVQDMFDKRGYRQPKYDEDGRELGQSPRRVSPEPRKDVYNTDEIELLYKFCEYTENGGMYIDKPSALTEEHRKACDKLYSFLRSADSGGVFIPLYIDPTSGAGVYIIGDRNFHKANSKECHVYIMSFIGCDPENEYFEELDGTVGDFSYEIKRYESVRDAFDKLEEGLNNAEEPYCESYTRYNSKHCSAILADDILKDELGERFIKFMTDRDSKMKRLGEEQEQLRKNAILEQEKENRKRLFPKPGSR